MNFSKHPLNDSIHETQKLIGSKDPYCFPLLFCDANLLHLSEDTDYEPYSTGHVEGNDEYMPVEESGNMILVRYHPLFLFLFHTGVEVQCIVQQR